MAVRRVSEGWDSPTEPTGGFSTLVFVGSSTPSGAAPPDRVGQTTLGAGGDEVLERVARDLREGAWDLALAVVEEGLETDSVPTLARVDSLARLGQLPAFIGELGRQVAADPEPGRTRPDARLAEVARDHARHREELGFAPREVVTELLVLRRVLWRFLSQAPPLDGGGLLVAERRLHETLDAIVIECVGGYFERATAELSDKARRDPLTRLLNREAFWTELERELERARRFGHGLSFVFADLDWFKQVNDTRGHSVGDQVLQAVAECLTTSLRGSDLAGRMGGDEFAVALVETEADAGPRFVERAGRALQERARAIGLPLEVTFSGGTAHFPSEANAATALFELADARLYERKRSR